MVTVTDVRYLAEIADAVTHERRIKWSDDLGGTVREGTVRRTYFADSDGASASAVNVDMRELYIRITTDSGAEIYRNVAELVSLMRSHYCFVRAPKG